jgi:hypothetical protein
MPQNAQRADRSTNNRACMLQLHVRLGNLTVKPAAQAVQPAAAAQAVQAARRLRFAGLLTHCLELPSHSMTRPSTVLSTSPQHTHHSTALDTAHLRTVKHVSTALSYACTYPSTASTAHLSTCRTSSHALPSLSPKGVGKGVWQKPQAQQVRCAGNLHSVPHDSRSA